MAYRESVFAAATTWTHIQTIQGPRRIRPRTRPASQSDPMTAPVNKKSKEIPQDRLGTLRPVVRLANRAPIGSLRW